MTARKPQHPVPYLNRRDQYRMLAMVGLLCLVMVAIKVAARPESWHWLLPPTQQGDQEAPPLEDVDFRVKPDSADPLPPDVFRTIAEDEDADQESASISEDTLTAATGESPQAASPDIDPDVLSAIEDNTVGVRREEMEAYHLMLDRIRRLPKEGIAAEAQNDVAFTVIMLQPDDYRGEIVGITGQLRRLTAFPVMENNRGIDRLYEGWIFTSDSDNNPWRFLCTKIPENVSLGEQITPVKVQLAGYFFKRSGYLSHGGQHVAPTLLARTFHIVPTPVNHASPEMSPQLRNGLLAATGLLFAAVVLVVICWTFADRRFAEGRLGQLASARLDASREELDALKHLGTVDPAEMFDSPTEDGDDPPRSL